MIERAYVIRVEGFDWNCPQHITPRFTAEQIKEALAPFELRLQDLERENKASRSGSIGPKPRSECLCGCRGKRLSHEETNHERSRVEVTAKAPFKSLSKSFPFGAQAQRWSYRLANAVDAGVTKACEMLFGTMH